MKKKALFMLTVGLILTSLACSQTMIKASKNYVTKSVKTENFKGIKILGSSDVIYQQAPKYKVEIYAPDNIIDYLDVYVKNDELIVSSKRNVSFTNTKRIEIRVSSPEINKLTINGSGDIELTNNISIQDDLSFIVTGSGDIKGKSIKCRNFSSTSSGSGDIEANGIKANNIHISVSGSGDVKAQQISCSLCKVNTSGSGDITLSGSSNDVEYKTSGSGDIDAVRVEAASVYATASGSGDINCYATEKLIARKSGSGEIAYKGNPKQTDFPRKGIRKIN